MNLQADRVIFPDNEHCRAVQSRAKPERPGQRTSALLRRDVFTLRMRMARIGNSNGDRPHYIVLTPALRGSSFMPHPSSLSYFPSRIARARFAAGGSQQR